ncbi:MAG TPA: chemotaxis protein [Deferrisomatales bacterium]|nr:chemotaxis protein [Deferrisomatales bacterium]
MAQHHPGILTEVGTNELEVVEFTIGQRPYAINVAKVREIIRPVEPMSVPDSHPCVLGVFRNRDEVLPLVDLGKWLKSTEVLDPAQTKIVVAEFNEMKVGFLVHGVNRIHRVSWEDLEAPKAGSMVDSQAAVGFLRLGRETPEGERIVFLLDFEGMVAAISPRRVASDSGEGAVARDRRAGKVVLIAEDSQLARKVLRGRLEGGGYTVVVAHDGAQAWEKLDAGTVVDAVISDIEMPRMDGHHLTRRIKGDERFSGVPVILYSSMIYEEVRHKGAAVGADAQVWKPDLAEVLATLDRLLFP